MKLGGNSPIELSDDSVIPLSDDSHILLGDDSPIWIQVSDMSPNAIPTQVMIPEGLATQHSGFIRDHLTAHKGLKICKFIIPDIDARVVPILADWMHRTHLPPTRSWNNRYFDRYSAYVNIIHYLFNLYRLTSYLKIWRLKGLLLKIMVDSILDPDGDGELPTYNTITLAFKYLPPKDAFIQILIDAHCTYRDLGTDTEEDIVDFAKLPTDALRRMMLKYRELIEKRTKPITKIKSEPDDGQGQPTSRKRVLLPAFEERHAQPLTEKAPGQSEIDKSHGQLTIERENGEPAMKRRKLKAQPPIENRNRQPTAPANPLPNPIDNPPNYISFPSDGQPARKKIRLGPEFDHICREHCPELWR
jgi:hypothetical protein